MKTMSEHLTAYGKHFNMSFSTQDIEVLRKAKQEGKTKEQALAVLARSRQNTSTEAKQPGTSPLVNRFTEVTGLGGTTDVFGRLMNRSVIGNLLQTDAQKRSAEVNAQITGQPVMSQQEINKMGVEAPTGKEIAGAVAQTGAIGAGALLTGGTSLAGQMAVGTGLGYLYDVGADLSQGVEGAEAFKPGAETIAGALIPPVLRGAGAGLRGLGTIAGKTSTGIGQAVSSVGDTVSATGIGQRIQEMASKVPRAVRRVGEYVDEGKEMAELKKTSSPSVAKAINEGVPVETIKYVQQFDQPTKASAKEMMDLAEAGRGADLPQTIPGKIAGQQLDLVEKQRKTIGAQIGEFSNSLPTQAQDITPSLQNLDSVLTNNGIVAQDGKLVFENVAITPKQQNVLQELYNLTNQRTALSPRQIHQMDQLFSKLQREARFEGVDDVFVKVPTADGETTTNIYKVFRDVFSQQLDEIAEQAGRADIKQLNREYRTLRNLTDNVENTIVRQSKLEGVDVDASESASVALRRLFSNATSRAEYQQVYDQLDAMSRSVGYDGARADTLMDFYLTDMKPLYPETVPQASFEGGVKGAIGSFVDKVLQTGAPNVKDQREALKKILEEATEATPQ